MKTIKLNPILSLFLTSLVLCNGQTSNNNNGYYIDYQLPNLDYATYQVPNTVWYNSLGPNLYWPVEQPSANTPEVTLYPQTTINEGIPYYINTVPNIGYYPTQQPNPSYYPVAGGVYPVSNTPASFVPNSGVYPQTPQPRPPIYPSNRPQGKPTTPNSDDDDSRREPLIPISDGVLDPEVGLKQSLVNLAPTMFGNTLNLGELRQNGFTTWLNFLRNPPKPWWQGSNVCIKREEKFTSDDDEETNHKMDFFTLINVQSCVEYGNKYECTIKERKNTSMKVMTVTYECCHGSQLEKRAKCVEKELLPLVETIEKMNGTQFLSITQNVRQMMNTQNITVFLPSDAAFEKFSDMMLLTNQVEMYSPSNRYRRALDGFSSLDLAMNHMIDGFSDVSPEKAYNSMFNNATLFVKDSYSGRMINCAKIGKTVHATNGIVHSVDRVLMPINKNLTDVLKGRSDLSALYQMLERSQLLGHFTEDKMWTIFAPTNNAFKKLNSKLLNAVMDYRGCSRLLMKYHLVPQTLCSSEVGEREKIKNLMGENLILALPKDHSEESSPNVFSETNPAFLVNGVKVTKPDIMATNGIIHILDDVIVSDSGLAIDALLLKNNLTKMYSLIEKAGMMNELLAMDTVTFFFPTDEALENSIVNNKNQLLKDILEQNEDEPLQELYKDALRLFILRHISRGSVPSCELEDNGFLKTVDQRERLRINLYSTFPASNIYNRGTVDCARMVQIDRKQCNNVLYEIDRPLTMYEGSLLTQVQLMDELSMLKKILIRTETEKILSMDQDITFLAPTNEAFEAMDKADYEELLTNKKMVDAFMKQHIFQGVTCCAGLNYVPWPFTTYIKAYNDVQLDIRNKQIGNVPIKSCDHVAGNGVMHLTNKIMMPRKIEQENNKSNFEILLFGADDTMINKAN